MVARAHVGQRTAAACLGLLGALLAGSGAVEAQTAAPVSDGQIFQNQSRSTQDAFMATFGPTCALQEWLWQHALALGPDIVDGPPASDGQKLTDQDDAIQLMFVALFGTQANAEWVAEHNAVVAHRVLLTTAPIQCPAARTSRAQEVIGTTRLSVSVKAAREGALDDAYAGFAAFKTIWNIARAGVTTRSTSLAQGVQTAVDQVNALIGDPKAPVPQQSQYYPALQNLLKVVQDANATLAP